MAFEGDMEKAVAKDADGIHGVILSAVHKSGKWSQRTRNAVKMFV